MWIETWSIQHSCQPMINWSHISVPSQCRESIQKVIKGGENADTQSNSRDNQANTSNKDIGNIDNYSQIGNNTGEDKKNEKNIKPDIIGIGVGSAVGVGLIVAEAPPVTVVGACIGIWFAVREAIKAISAI
jgi:hypothetical protein